MPTPDDDLPPFFVLGESAQDDDISFQLTHLEIEAAKPMDKQGSGASTGHSTDSSKSYEEEEDLHEIYHLEGCK